VVEELAQTEIYVSLKNSHLKPFTVELGVVTTCTFCSDIVLCRWFIACKIWYWQNSTLHVCELLL